MKCLYVVLCGIGRCVRQRVCAGMLVCTVGCALICIHNLYSSVCES